MSRWSRFRFRIRPRDMSRSPPAACDRWCSWRRACRGEAIRWIALAALEVGRRKPRPRPRARKLFGELLHPCQALPWLYRLQPVRSPCSQTKFTNHLLVTCYFVRLIVCIRLLPCLNLLANDIWYGLVCFEKLSGRILLSCYCALERQVHYCQVKLSVFSVLVHWFESFSAHVICMRHVLVGLDYL
jgi:hypothetical protein